MTRAEDIEVALTAGAEALGFVHHPGSPRHVCSETVASLSATVARRALVVIVVVHADPRSLGELLHSTGADAVQLCGPTDVATWRKFDGLILRRVGVGPGALDELQRWRGVADLFVLDHPGSEGGSGRSVDLDLAAACAGRAPCLLAGGLHGGNVAAGLRRVRPLGVDASSRLEATPGIKSAEAVARFVSTARQTLEEIGR